MLERTELRGEEEILYKTTHYNTEKYKMFLLWNVSTK